MHQKNQEPGKQAVLARLLCIMHGMAFVRTP